MNRLLPFTLALLAVAAQAQTQLSPEKARISDNVIQRDLQAYEGLQARIKGLNDKGRPVADYHLSKAQCWLDVSFHEYTRNDRGPFPQAALSESEKLIVGMERGDMLGMDTPLVGEAVKLREDLWARAQALKGHPGWRCAAAKTACGEVELVHAGNEHAQQQWRHAKPYVQIAEDLLGEAQQLAEQCLPPPAPQPPPPPPPSPVAPVEELWLSADVVFNFDRHEPEQIRPGSRATLEALVQRLQREGWTVREFVLTGHADRLNSTGQADYNQRLSERRVATVAALLGQAGFASGLMRTGAQGDTQQVQDCRFAGARVRGADLEECLLPNRRVEVRVRATRQSTAPR